MVKKPMTMPALTRGDRAICWIAKYCLYPDGPHKGKPVRLSEAECWQVRQLYDNPDGPDRDTSLSGPLAAYLALLHTCGTEALQQEFRPHVDVDSWTVWRATSERLQRVLKRDGEAVICPRLGKRYPPAAA
jgi:hypothetical protein